MTTSHVSPELLAKVLRGELPPHTLLRLVREHLREVCPCPRCAEALATLYQRLDDLEALSDENAEDWAVDGRGTRPDALGEGGEEGGVSRQDEVLSWGSSALSPRSGSRGAAPGSTHYGPAFQKAALRALRHAGTVHDHKEVALADWRSLRGLDRSQAVARIQGSAKRYCSVPLASLLLADSRRSLERDPWRAELCASLAVLVLGRLPEDARDFRSSSLELRARAAVADALRVAGDRQAANRSYRELRTHLQENPSDDPEVAAEVAFLEAALRRDERRFAEAHGLLSQAALGFRQAGRREGLAQAWVQKGALHRLEQDPAAALVCFQQAQEMVTPEENAEAHLCALAYRATSLCDLGRSAEAGELVRSHRRLFERSKGVWGGRRRSWLEGRIHHGGGRTGEAEAALEVARGEYRTQGDLHLAEAVTLERLVLLLGEARWAEMEAELARLVLDLSPLALRPEESAALILMQDAVAARSLREPSLRRLQISLEHLHQELRFVSPS